MIDPNNAALIIIDMQNGFIDKDSSLGIAGAEATLPACSQALARARSLGIPVFHVCREYAADGSDVESIRFETWLSGGKPISKASENPKSLDFPDPVAPQGDDRVIVKPRFSAFFGTDLHETLQAEGVTTVILIGTTTPNCIRSSCYDALSLDYNVVIIEDCTSSRTPEVQAGNIADMAFIGAQVIDVERFCAEGLEPIRDVVGEHRSRIERG